MPLKDDASRSLDSGLTWKWEFNSIYLTAPPTCALEISFDKECKRATLSCSCSAIPFDGESPSDAGMVFSFFNGTGHLIEDNAANPVQINDIEAGVDLTYSCRGCNGLYYGNSSYDTASKVCTISKYKILSSVLNAIPISYLWHSWLDVYSLCNFFWEGTVFCLVVL